MHPGIISALVAALLFGASTPFAKVLVGEVPPLLLAGLLYAGSGLGLAILIALRKLREPASIRTLALPRGRDLGWLAGAILAGGVSGPFLLLVGLLTTPASTASLLLNLEGVLTALLAWFVFRENFDRRIALGMALIVAGGVVLCAPSGESLATSWGSLAVVGACACWALDNNLTRKVSAHDAMLIACAKGLCAGAFNLGLSALIGHQLPAPATAAFAALVGFLGYGLSLTLYVVALRQLGTARTGAYFSVAPFFGAVLALLFGGEVVSTSLAIAAILMAAGVWLHLSERHAHWHMHQRIAHTHPHRHDEHHRHAHDFPWDGKEPHTHPHVHEPVQHAHPHYPDIHHQHRH